MAEKEKKVEQITMSVEGMKCPKCKAKVEKALGGLEGVRAFSVDLATGQTSVSYDAEKTSFDMLKQAVLDSDFSVKTAS